MSILLKKSSTLINKGKRLPFILASRPSGVAKYIKILAPGEMLQRLPIALAQIKAGNTSENLLNKIRQILYPFYRAKEITKKVYINIMN